ncbi:hypothetical protein [Streptomyces coffeae]|uniref:Uncharacterized protein n=1 Tax=Streptomyces coffeae TaxID=621382 RepID=A0ABS1NRL3_9ACTN|nr:hypothetical protein [Streptomyces coffeae]MBL1102740.1 hypothetical protein [Streptomyces coffeae]
MLTALVLVAAGLATLKPAAAASSGAWPPLRASRSCPFHVPKNSSRGQLLAVKDGITQMLKQLDLTDDKRDALNGDLEAVTALAERLADVPTPAGPTPRELGAADGFIPLTQLTDTIRTGNEQPPTP